MIKRMNNGTLPRGTLHYTSAYQKTKQKAKQKTGQSKAELIKEQKQAEYAAQADWIMNNLADQIERLRMAKR